MTDALAAPIVLVVDDDEDCRALALHALTTAGLRVVAMPGGREALDALRSGLKPAVIVLDLQMPGVSGWDVWDWLQGSAEHRETPIVFWTGSGLSTGAISGARIISKADVGKLVAACESELSRLRA